MTSAWASTTASASKLPHPTVMFDKAELTQAAQGLSEAVAPKKEQQTKMGGSRQVSAGGILQRSAQDAVRMGQPFWKSRRQDIAMSEDLNTTGQSFG